MGDGLFGPVAHLLQGEALGPLFQDDCSGDLFGGVSHRHAHDGDIRDAGQGADRLLDLGGIHVEAARQDQLLLPIGHRDEPIAVNADVAGLEPALGGEDARGFLGRVEVPAKDLWPAHDDLAGLAVLDVLRVVLQGDESQLRGGEGDAEHAVAALGGQGSARQDGRGFG